MTNQVVLNDNSPNNSLIESEFEHLCITPESEIYLKSTAQWSLFLAIVGFISLGIMLISGIFMIGISNVVGEFQDFQAMPIPQLYIGIGVMYIVFAGLYFFPLYFLLLFSNKTKQALHQKNQTQLDEGFRNMKRFAKFVGIVTIIVITLSVVLIPVIAATLSAAKLLQ